MSNAQQTIKEWILIQQNNISKAHALINSAHTLCKQNIEDMDAMLLEVYASNIIMHIELISHYNISIQTLFHETKNITPQLNSLITQYRDDICTLTENYYSLQHIVEEKFLELDIKAKSTQKLLKLL